MSERFCFGSELCVAWVERRIEMRRNVIGQQRPEPHTFSGGLSGSGSDSSTFTAPLPAETLDLVRNWSIECV